ncbi:hypothetical protein L6232_24975, partial [Shewanella sp. C31]|nr:hypothetical protein [Shewanella electrica]
LANGQVVLSNGGALTIDTVNANGNVTLNSGDSVTTAANGLITADALAINAEHDVNIATQVNSVDIAVADTGAINLANQGELQVDQL